MSATPNLVWLKSFDYAARHLSFTAAAQELGITQTALSLHIRSLETQLGCPLFVRAARNLRLTEVGQAYAFSVRRALSDISLSTTSLFGSAQKHEIVVRVPISTATLFLAQKLPTFFQTHPDISVRLISNIWAESAGDTIVDVDLRFGIGDWTDKPARKISSERIVPIAANKHQKTHANIHDLIDLPVVHILGFQDMWQRYLNTEGIDTTTARSTCSVDTSIAAIDIVASDGGYAVVLERYAKTAIETGKPISMIGKSHEIDQGHFIVSGQGARSDLTARGLFEKWLESSFAT